MAGRKKTAPETVEAEVVNEVAVTQPAKMEFRLINPTEDGFLRVIKWNKEELEAAVRQKMASYENVVYTEDSMQQAKKDRAELNGLIKDIEDRRKIVKKIINEPYNVFEAELKEILALIQEPVGIIDKQVKAFEDQQKEEKKAKIRASYDEVIGDLESVLPFDKVFDSRYLNQTYKLATAQADIKSKVEKVRTDLETIDSLESKYKLNARMSISRRLTSAKHWQRISGCLIWKKSWRRRRGVRPRKRRRESGWQRNEKKRQKKESGWPKSRGKQGRLS